jgi:hypothetical protein
MMPPAREPARTPQLVRRRVPVEVAGTGEEATVTPLPQAPPEPPAVSRPQQPAPPSPAAATPETASPPAPEARPARQAPARPAGAGALWSRILAAGESARRERTRWTKYSPYLPEPLWLRLQKRIAADTRSSRQMRLAANHYLQVAFEDMPRQEDGTFSPDAAAGTGREWLAAHPAATAGASSGSQLTHEMKEDLIILRTDLAGMLESVPVWAVLAAYTERLLDVLDAVPPPPRQ